QGANIVWDYLATGTSAGYGQISPSSPFTQSAIPLFAGSTYYYTILNLYDQNDVAYASTVFGGIVSFTYQSQAQITAPVLINPADAQVFNATPTIRFQCDAVPSANSYTVYLFNRVTSFAGSTQEIDLPIWNGSTTNTQIDFAARQNLLKGKYVWFVVPNTATGSGTASATRSFNYNVTLGKFRLYLSPTNGTTNLVNFSLQINSTTGGYSPSVPMIISNSEIAADSIPVDVYQFTAKKPGFSDTTYTLTLSATTQLVQVLKIRPFPSTVTGKVKDQAGAAVKDATIQFLDILTNVTKSFTSSTSGDFSVNLPQSSYKVTVSKPGYLSPAVRTYTVEMGQLDITGSPFVLTLDKVTVSGTTINDEGLPVQLATVKATKGTVIQEVTTNATGIYSFELSSGSWTIEAAKSGFVRPNPVNMNLATGGSVSGQNIVLVPRANQVNGIIYKVSQSGASSSLIPASGVTVTATPVSGPVITGVTGSSGQYQLSLKSGTYTISSQIQGYTPNSNPQITLGVGQTITGIDINLNPNPSSVSGIITTTGGAVLGDAVVKAGSISATSLPTGNYQLSLSAGTHTLTVTKAGYVTPGTVTVTLTPGQQLGGINFSLNPNASTITGSVVSLGQPLTNATVSAQQGSNTPVVTTTGNTGEFVLSVVPGNWKLVASKQGFIVPAGTPVDSFFVGAGQTSANHVFSLVENTATIKGAISASGAGLNGAAILIKDINNSSLTYASLTDINGEYSLNVPAGTSYSLTASLTGYSTYNANIANLVARDIRINNGILTALPASIAGKVSNNLSQPLNEVKVYLVDNSTNVAIDSTVTDVTGAYILGTFAGTYKVRATLRGYTVDEDVISVGLGQALNNANLTINANFALVSGTILDGSTPLAGVVVSLSSSQGGGTATTATDGTYSILQLVGDVYSLSVTKQGYADIQQTGLTINGGENKTLNFGMDKLSGSVSGVVKTTAGELVPDATVSLTSGNNSFSAVTSAAGQYSINNLAFGTYDVVSVKTGYTSPAVSQVTLVLGNSTITKDISGMVLNNSRISGKITDATGIALGNAVVKVSGSAGSASANSDFSGNYELASLADGTYEIFISKAGYVTLNDVVTLAGSAIKSVQLLAANTTIPGTVKSAA
ncbi:MAG: carboxypeptidase regulatory-like domain-containing protein, partial [Ignavibacteriales bacterium]|nr:carboxypeptidase regulatory-like domain-containing protein [Ignavibacteriales bacterium]